MTRQIAREFVIAAGAASLRTSPSFQAATDKVIKKISTKQAQAGGSLYGSWLFVDWHDKEIVVADVSEHPHANVRRRVVADAVARSKAASASKKYADFDCIYLVWGFLLFMFFWHYGPRIFQS